MFEGYENHALADNDDDELNCAKISGFIKISHASSSHQPRSDPFAVLITLIIVSLPRNRLILYESMHVHQATTNCPLVVGFTVIETPPPTDWRKVELAYIQLLDYSIHNSVTLYVQKHSPLFDIFFRRVYDVVLYV